MSIGSVPTTVNRPSARVYGQSPVVGFWDRLLVILPGSGAMIEAALGMIIGMVIGILRR